MGNCFSNGRCLYWGVLLVLMIPPQDNAVHCWNILPNFGRDKPGGGGAPTPDFIDAASTAAATAAADAATHMGSASTPMIGPVDAPHLRYIPSYFSQQLPTQISRLYPSMLSALHGIRTKMYAILWYKPPVGIVSVWSCIRIIEKMYGVWSPPPPTSGDEALADAEGRVGNSLSKKYGPWGSIGKLYSANVRQLGLSKEELKQQQKMQLMQKRRRKRSKMTRKGRSFDLDIGDRSYENFGGVETVRVRACQEGLRSALSVIVEEESIPTESFENAKGPSLFGSKKNGNSASGGETNANLPNKDYPKDIRTALEALQLSCPPKGSREYFVEQSANALSKLSHYLTASNTDNTIIGNNNKATPSIQDQNIELLLRHSAKLIELRTLDALLRTLRDRHLIVAARLRRAQHYWKWRINLSRNKLGRFLYRTRHKLMTMMPLGIPDFRERNQREYERATAAWEREITWLGKVEQALLSRPSEMKTSDLLTVAKNGNNPGSNNEGWSSWLQNNVFGNVNDAATNQASLADSAKFMIRAKNRVWIRETELWNKEARIIVKDALSDTVGSSFTPIQRPNSSREMIDDGNTSASMESRFLQKWADYNETASDTSAWLSVLSLVDFSASTQRAGEQQHFQLTNLALRIKRYDFLGIPSSALLLAAANTLHDKIIAQHYQEILDFFKAVFSAFWGIVEFRFYTPMKDIVLDLLNRRPRMVDPFALMNEQISLDNMLKDLGVGDGTRATRATALAAASRLYEQEVAGGAIRGLLRGKVAQLMLIQIQQLKADLLEAMDTIDSLVDANRLNVQLVASIPAVLILFFGTRALYLFWSNVRMKDLRLPKDVHAEMSDYLKKVEECLVLANYEFDASFASTEETQKLKKSPSSTKTNAVCLGPKEMGQLLVLLHSYLNLLDYMSPPFPFKQCDSIHQSVQNLLMQGQMSTSRQLDLLRVIQAKHTELLKTL